MFLKSQLEGFTQESKSDDAEKGISRFKMFDTMFYLVLIMLD